jgi:hypothetical protein
MKTYKNVTCFDRQDLSHTDLLNAIKEQLELSYPNLGGEELTIVADLMIRYDEDITESFGQFICYSAY